MDNIDMINSIVEKTASAVVKAAAELNNNEVANKVSVLESKMIGFEKQQDTLESKMDALFDKVFDKLDVLATGRPSWAVAIIISILGSVCGGLVIWTVSH